MMRKQLVVLLSVGAIAIVIASVGCGTTGTTSTAASYPQKDIVTIVPFAPGGGSDLIARAAVPYLSKYLPRQVNILVQNVEGAGGRVGSFQLYDAKPDGYTIGVVEPFSYVVPQVIGEAGNRKVEELSWLARASAVPYMATVSPKGPIKSLQDVKGKKIRAAVSASSLAGSITILQHLGAEVQPVMYSGGAETCLATMRGDTDITLQVAPTVMRQVEASNGQLIPIALFDDKPFPAAPNVPTVKDQGISIPDDLMTMVSYDYLYAAPPGLDGELGKILGDALQKTINDEAFKAELEKGKLPTNYLSGAQVKERVAKLPGALKPHEATLKEAVSK